MIHTEILNIKTGDRGQLSVVPDEPFLESQKPLITSHSSDSQIIITCDNVIAFTAELTPKDTFHSN